MNVQPTADDYEGFRGQVVRPTPGVPMGSFVEIEREQDGWHLFITGGTEEQRSVHWDIWCDDWTDAEQWFREWAIDWRRADQ